MTERKSEISRGARVPRMAENVSMHFPETPTEAVPGEALQVWLDSPAHRTNLEGRYSLTGVGAAASPDGTLYVTQIVVLPAAPDAAE